MPKTTHTVGINTELKAVLFDLDGTLADTSADFVKVLDIQCDRHGLTRLDPQKVRDTVSDGARALTQLAFGGQVGDPIFDARRAELLELYLQVVGDEAKLFEGMNKALRHIEVSGLVWGIVTNKPKKYAAPLLSRLSLDERCQVLICPDDVTTAKPDPEGLLLAAKNIGHAPPACLYVGDHVRDIEAGKAAAMKTMAARYGYISDINSVSSWGADYIIDTPVELLSHF